MDEYCSLETKNAILKRASRFILNSKCNDEGFLRLIVEVIKIGKNSEYGKE